MVGKKRIKPFDIINLIILSLLGLTTLYPFINLLFMSVSSIEEVMKSSSIMLYPKSISFDAYEYVLKYGNLSNAFKITVTITVLGTIINLVLTTLGAYSLSNKNLPGRKFLMSLVILTMLFNGGLIPTYMVIKALHLIDTVWVLMIPNAISTFNLILMRNFFQSIPPSLSESARIDGCSEFRILMNIILPLSMPIIATLSLFYGVGHWNEYFNAIIYNNKNSLSPLQVLIRNMFANSVDMLDPDRLPPPVETVRAATVILATLPIICLYPFLQKYFVQGIMIGAIKA